jgi:phosphohistidine phosphatase
MISLYILRHADAVNVGDDGVKTDEDRHLSEKGIETITIGSKALGKMGISLDKILTSPLKRAQQTAEIIAKELGIKEKNIIVTDKLKPSFEPKKFLKELKKHDGSSICIVGHEPDFSSLISRLLSGVSDLNIDMKKGGMALVDLKTPDWGKGYLRWLITGKQLAVLGKSDDTQAEDKN